MCLCVFACGSSLTSSELIFHILNTLLWVLQVWPWSEFLGQLQSLLTVIWVHGLLNSLKSDLLTWRLNTSMDLYYNLPNSGFWGWLSVESQPQNPEFRNNPENFHSCIRKVSQRMLLWIHNIWLCKLDFWIKDLLQYWQTWFRVFVCIRMWLIIDVLRTDFPQTEHSTLLPLGMTLIWVSRSTPKSFDSDLGPRALK